LPGLCELNGQSGNLTTVQRSRSQLVDEITQSDFSGSTGISCAIRKRY
jgi:hypothetical protein